MHIDLHLNGKAIAAAVLRHQLAGGAVASRAAAQAHGLATAAKDLHAAATALKAAAAKLVA